MWLPRKVWVLPISISTWLQSDAFRRWQYPKHDQCFKASIAVIQHLGQKQLGEKKVCFILQLESAIQGSQGSKEWQEPRRSTASWLALMACWVCLPLAPRTTGPGTIHSKLGLRVPIVKQENSSQGCPRVDLVGIFSQLRFSPSK